MSVIIALMLHPSAVYSINQHIHQNANAVRIHQSVRCYFICAYLDMHMLTVIINQFAVVFYALFAQHSMTYGLNCNPRSMEFGFASKNM